MTNENILRFRRIYGIILSISIILAGICFIAGCIGIYSSGEQPYSREAVADTFSDIAVPVYICLALTVIGFVLEFVYPVNAKTKNAQNSADILKRLTSKKDSQNCDSDTLKLIKKERTSRKRHSLRSALLMASGSVIFLAYSLDPNNYSSDINSSVLNAMGVLIPCLAIPFTYAVFTVYRNEKSMRREIDILKQFPNTEKTENTDISESFGVNKTAVFLRYALLFIGAAILIFGYASGGTADVLTKAVNICTECIGLG